MQAVPPLQCASFCDALIPVVQALVKTPLRFDVPGASVTTFAIGGALRVVVTVDTVQELSKVLSLLHGEGQPVRVLGNGSNVLIGDAGLTEWIIKLGAGMKRIETEGARFEVFGAAPLMSFARRVSEDGVSGLEFAAGIPASVGGAVFMNAGAHGSEISSCAVLVRGMMPDGSLCEWKREDLPWRYRYSGLPVGAVVTSVVLDLARGDKDTIARKCADNLAARRATQPLTLPSAGSVFKNPSPQTPAGKILEGLGMKGRVIGGAEVSDLHANWIVNPKREATAQDVVALIELCRERALVGAGIEIEPEIKLWS
jgi:UDP-N-acetylmuramate dehydrogenase